MKKVIGGGPSDHDAVLQDFDYADHGRWNGFRAVGFNVNHDSDDDTDRVNRDNIQPTFERIMDFHPDVLLLLEVRDSSGIVEMCQERFNLWTRTKGEFAIAGTKRFKPQSTELRLMSPVEYWTKNFAQITVVEDRENETKLKLFAGHPPAHITVEQHPSFPKVHQVHHDYAPKVARIAKNSRMPFCGFEDRNVDPVKDRPLRHDGDWKWLFPDPLRYVRADGPTHGGHRYIDNFMTHRLVPS